MFKVKLQLNPIN